MKTINLKPSMTVAELELQLNNQFEVLTLNGNKAGENRRLRALTKTPEKLVVIEIDEDNAEKEIFNKVGINLRPASAIPSVQNNSGDMDDLYELDLGIQIRSTEEKGINYGTCYLTFSVEKELLTPLQENFNFENLAKLINNILWNDEFNRKILESAINYCDLYELSETNYDWFSYCPRIVITEIDGKEFGNLYESYLDSHLDEIKELFEYDFSEISDEEEFKEEISDFISNTNNSIEKEFFDEVWKSIND